MNDRDPALDPCVGPCGHICCKLCWSKWISIKKCCPICKEYVSAETISTMVIH